ncbi:unnamed protein product [Clonostachys rosea]|uniref:Uncharacterized protein n=1 Tax=Bionectria ochroleuca TaxID=29856 RepID=A0ABY6UNQ1_BIOOC|nr:unnamed protein product [Clonostachys rosea]
MALQQWVSQNAIYRANNVLYYVLQEISDAQDIDSGNLSPESWNKVQVLKRLSEGIPFEVLLVVLNKEVIALYDDGYGHFLEYCEARGESEDGASLLHDAPREELSVQNITDMEGRLVRSFLRLNEEDVLQEDCFKDADGVEQYFGEFPDEPTGTVCNYSFLAVAMVPTDYLDTYLGDDFPEALRSPSLEPNNFYIRLTLD